MKKYTFPQGTVYWPVSISGSGLLDVKEGNWPGTQNISIGPYQLSIVKVSYSEEDRLKVTDNFGRPYLNRIGILFASVLVHNSEDLKEDYIVFKIPKTKIEYISTDSAIVFVIFAAKDGIFFASDRTSDRN